MQILIVTMIYLIWARELHIKLLYLIWRQRNRQQINLSISRGFDNLDADDVDLLGLEDDLELDDDEKGSSDPSQVIFDHELEDI